MDTLSVIRLFVWATDSGSVAMTQIINALLALSTTAPVLMSVVFLTPRRWRRPAVALYVFWFFVCWANADLMTPLLFPVLFLFDPVCLPRYLAFLWLPLLVAAACVLAPVALFVVFGRWKLNAVALTLLTSVLFLGVFVVAAGDWKNALMASSLKRHGFQVSCLNVATFPASLWRTRGPSGSFAHALMTAGGQTYYWSYATLDFEAFSSEGATPLSCDMARNLAPGMF